MSLCSRSIWLLIAGFLCNLGAARIGDPGAGPSIESTDSEAGGSVSEPRRLNKWTSLIELAGNAIKKGVLDFANDAEYLRLIKAARSEPGKFDDSLGYVYRKVGDSCSNAQQERLKNAQALSGPDTNRASEVFDQVSEDLLEQCDDWSCSWLKAAKKVYEFVQAEREYQAAVADYEKLRVDPQASHEELQRLWDLSQEKKKARDDAEEEARKAIDECEMPEDGGGEDGGGDSGPGGYLVLLLLLLGCCGCYWAKQRAGVSKHGPEPSGAATLADGAA